MCTLSGLCVASTLDTNTVCPTATAGGDDPPDDINKLKTKVRRLYDIANVLTTLNLISKVHIPPSRRPAFVWLGIERINVQQQATSTPASLAAPNASHSEAASSTATGSSIQNHTHLRHLSSGTLNTSSATQDDSQSTSSKGLKRGAVTLEPCSAQKCARTAAAQPSNILYGTVNSPRRLPPSASFYGQQANREVAAPDRGEGAAEPGYSPTLGHQSSEAGLQGKLGLRPTPVPITPEGGQSDGVQQRHEVS